MAKTAEAFVHDEDGNLTRSWRLSQKGDFCGGIMMTVQFSGIFFWRVSTLPFYDVRILVLGVGRLVFFVCEDSTPMAK